MICCQSCNLCPRYHSSLSMNQRDLVLKPNMNDYSTTPQPFSATIELILSLEQVFENVPSIYKDVFERCSSCCCQWHLRRASWGPWPTAKISWLYCSIDMPCYTFSLVWVSCNLTSSQVKTPLLRQRFVFVRLYYSFATYLQNSFLIVPSSREMSFSPPTQLSKNPVDKFTRHRQRQNHEASHWCSCLHFVLLEQLQRTEAHAQEALTHTTYLANHWKICDAPIVPTPVDTPASQSLTTPSLAHNPYKNTFYFCLHYSLTFKL